MFLSLEVIPTHGKKTGEVRVGYSDTKFTIKGNDTLLIQEDVNGPNSKGGKAARYSIHDILSHS
jgi:hypothetical protein